MNTALLIQLLQASPILPGESVKEYLQLTLLAAGLLALISTVWWQADKETYEEVTEDLPVTAFDQIDVWGTLNVLITSGNEYSVMARGTRRAIHRLRLRQSGKRLVLGSRFGFFFRQRDLLLTLTAPYLEKIDVSGACLVQMSGFKDLRKLNVEVTGASNVSVEGEIHTLYADVTGASRLTLLGKGNLLTADVTGASMLQAFDYEVDEATVEVTGACFAKLHVIRSLIAEATGASKIQYRGTPSVQIDSTGASTINRI